MSTNTLSIKVVNSPDDAPDYKTMKEPHHPASLKEAVIVRNGTTENRSTVDLIFVNKEGEKHIAMITGRLITSLAKVIGDE